jgi:hypothetical protein
MEGTVIMLGEVLWDKEELCLKIDEVNEGACRVGRHDGGESLV